jgi:hypothetical protein
MKRVLLNSTIALLGAPAVLFGAVVDGRVTASAYAFEGDPTDSTNATHLRSHAAVRLTASDFGVGGLTLHSYLRGTTDLTESADSDPRLRVYNLYLRYRGSGLEFGAGRQRVFAGVGYGTIDGARIDVQRAGLRLTAYGGALIPVADEGFNSPGDAHLVGARLSTSRFAGIDLALSIADRERDPTAYAAAGRYSGFVGQLSPVRRRVLGLQAQRRFGLHSLRGRFDYDLLGETARRSEIGGRLGLSKDLALSAEWRHREPQLYEGSFLSVFPSQGYDEIGLRFSYRVTPDLALSARAATVAYDGDDSQRLGLSATVCQNVTVGYHRSQGYAGANDGLSGSLFYPLRRSLVVRAELDLASYERFEADERDGLVTAMAGVTWRPSRTLTVDGQLQGLRNPSYDSDLRLLLRASWRFRR